MNGYGALAGRYLKQQRRRSLLTIIGIILSVALISAIGTMGQAVKDNLVENTIYEDGSFHIAYTESTQAFADELKSNVLFDQEGILVAGGSTKLEKDNVAYLNGLTADGFDLLPIHLEEGRLPQAAGEIVVEQWLLQTLPSSPKLGDRVTLNGMDGKPAEFTIVGLLKNQKGSQIDHVSKVFAYLDDAALKALPSDANRQVYLTFKPGVKIRDQLGHFESLDKSFRSNYKLLALTGDSADTGLNKALFIMFGTLIGLVVLSTIAVIYNAFHIAVLERIRQFGLLRTLGATPRQVRNLVLREATVLSAIAIPLGLAIGWGGLWLAIWLMTHNGMNILQMNTFKLTFHWWIIGGSVAVGLFAVYIAAWLPARKASSVSPVEAAKGAGSIVRETYRKLRIPSLLQVMGVEGKMASANIRRNKAKFRITTFSIAVSITLFLVFHYFTQQALDLSVDTTENTKIAFEVYPYSGGVDENGNPRTAVGQDRLSAEQIARIKAIDGVDEVYGHYGSYGMDSWLDPNLLNKSIFEKTNTMTQDMQWQGTDFNSVMTEFRIYDEARLAASKEYLVEGTADPEKLTADNSVLVIQTVKPYIRSSQKRIQYEITRLKVGDTIRVRYQDANGNPVIREAKVGGILSQSPFDAPYQENVLVAIGTPTTIRELMADPATPADSSDSSVLYGVQIAIKDGADTDTIKAALESFISDIPTGAQLIDIVSEKKEQRQFALQMQIFVYGFLIIIGTIGSLNIINTVQTNLLLRRREIGLLQSVGMTLGQVRRMASAEGVWFGVIGGVWGIGFGALISYFLYRQLNDLQGLPFIFPWTAALVATGCAIAVGLLSVQGPLRRMNKTSLIDRLREE